MDLGLRGRVALVTGAAGHGIGYACAEVLAREGARVAICSRRPDAIAAAGDWVRAAVPGAEVLAVPADVTRQADVERLLEQTRQSFGTVEILVNSAGRGMRGGMFDVGDEVWQESLEVNLMQIVRLSRLVLPPMLAAGWGRIINIGASSGRQPSEGQIASNVAKAGLMNFTKSLSTEIAARGVTVNTVLPGRIASERVLKAFTPEEQANRAQLIPMRRYGTPEEMAGAVAFLASEQAGYITGVALAVDGGLINSMF
jgi:3-oxoacyl-[acyl-carrier protein] reductase